MLDRIITIQYTQLIMQGGKVFYDEKFVKDLLQLKTESHQIKNYLKLLQAKSVLVYSTCRQFCQRIKTFVEGSNASEFTLKFENQYNQFLSTSNQESYYFPYIKDQDHEFDSANLQRFMDEYRFEYAEEFDINLDGFHFNVDQSDDQNNGHDSNQQKRLNQTNVLKEETGQEEQQKTLLKRQEKEDETTKKLSLKKSQTQHKIPPYLLSQIKAFSTLLSLNLTQFFHPQLSEAQNLIKSQVSEGAFLLKIYKNFLDEYMEYKLLNEGKCDDIFEEKEKQRIIDTINNYEGNENGKYDMLSIWKRIKDKLKSIEDSSQKIQQGEVKTQILQALKGVYLVFNLNISKPKLYGCIHHFKIFININHQKNDLKISQYRRPLRSLIALTLIHQMAHYLVRKIHLTELNQSGISFNIQSLSIGKKLVDQISFQYQHLPKYLKLTKLEKVTLDNRNIFKDHSLLINQFLQKYQKLIASVTKRTYQLDVIVNHVQNIQSIMKKNNSIMKQQEWKNHLQSMLIYAGKLSKQIKPTVVNQENETKYQFFFSLLKNRQIMMTIFKDPQFYSKIHQILQSTPIKVYYIENMPFIDKVIQNLEREDSTLFSSTNLSTMKFIQNILQKNLTVTKTQDIIQTLYQEINHESKIQNGNQIENVNQIQKYLKQIQGLFAQQNDDLKCILNNFQLSKWNQISEAGNKTRILGNLVNKLQNLVNMRQSIQMFQNFIKYSEVLSIIFQFPTFYRQQTTNESVLETREKCSDDLHANVEANKKRFQSGFLIEYKLFPQLNKNSKIYSKDFKLMKNLEIKSERCKVGVQPQSPQERLQYLPAGKVAKARNAENIGLWRGTCGNYVRKLEILEKQKRERLKKEKEAAQKAL